MNGAVDGLKKHGFILKPIKNSLGNNSEGVFVGLWDNTPCLEQEHEMLIA
jgi:hypothetical protein